MGDIITYVLLILLALFILRMLFAPVFFILRIIIIPISMLISIIISSVSLLFYSNKKEKYKNDELNKTES